ncbi:hypothetical protein RclHR1_08110008 [Rhizophagus clarus]|uniref:Uncharacterized protein n=1 Tax=Rhizophagus clarus TaxID=94130 RepID=A0A2Z6RZE2_9GLOM|nr:hypothetical protein RclHR1_08110008 [Rhizophagus clarus]GES73467.1 hypothetical protein GLOIN_2v1483663 [Rhizophagus clarus]
MVNAVPHQLRKRVITDLCPEDQFGSLLFADSTPHFPVAGGKATYVISGTVDEVITANKTILEFAYFESLESLTKKPIGDPYSQVITQSYKAGEPFNITAKDVSLPKFSDPNVIGYMQMAVGAPTSDPNKPVDLYGCAFDFFYEVPPGPGYPMRS